MIVTRSWLEEFIDLDGISNSKLYETFNAIGLEVDNLDEIILPEKVVVGRVLSCKKHPDADKLNVCQVDIGDTTLQIVCGAANVVSAEYVAVAVVGAVLPGNFEIKDAQLRGVESAGMICSGSELGLPKMGGGIMVLDESIGDLEVGRELGSYPKVADTVIELELTANRGDCLSIHGVARDLSAALERDLRSVVYLKKRGPRAAIGRKLSVRNNDGLSVNLMYKLSEGDRVGTTFLIELRLALVGIESNNNITNLLEYSTHATGVILRAYDARALRSSEAMIELDVKRSSSSTVVVSGSEQILSMVGIDQSDHFRVEGGGTEILFEASYVAPEGIIDEVATHKLKTDSLYYKTSRGSEPDLTLGMHYLQQICDDACECSFIESSLFVGSDRPKRTITVMVSELNAVIGQTISKSDISSMLARLGFTTQGVRSDSFSVAVPLHRHDIYHLQDIAEEILRIVGINNIDAVPLRLEERDRLTETTEHYRAKRDLRQRAVGRGFYEAVTYAFADQDKLERYGFAVTDASLRLVNPIAEELNVLRSTLVINLLDAVKRNVNYGMKRIPLFEIGATFDAQRNQSEKIAFVWSGQVQRENVANCGKPERVDFSFFVEQLSAIVGEVTLVACQESNGLIHPYQSATVMREGRAIGYLSKLHPEAVEFYGIPETFIAELDLQLLMPHHRAAKPISNYQGVYKDLSIVVDSSLSYGKIATALSSLDDELLRRYYPVDIYEDESLGEQKSVTVRFFIQSMEGTLSDDAIEALMQKILDVLTEQCGAERR